MDSDFEIKPAGINARGTAIMVDWLILLGIGILCLPVLGPWPSLYLMVPLSAVYFTLSDGLGTVACTPGKLLLGMRIKTQEDEPLDLALSFYRYVLTFSGTVLTFGSDMLGIVLLLLAVWYHRRSGGTLPHDEMTGTKTLVVRKPLLNIWLIHILGSMIMIGYLFVIIAYLIRGNHLPTGLNFEVPSLRSIGGY